jgi:hypothetical protein
MQPVSPLQETMFYENVSSEDEEKSRKNGNTNTQEYLQDKQTRFVLKQMSSTRIRERLRGENMRSKMAL